MRQPDISVVIPHLNQEDFLDKCLASLARQTIADVAVEIIVVDNGSEELPQHVVDRYPDVRLEQEATPGPGPARNRGVAVASGGVLAFIDADCTADERWLDVIWRVLSVQKSAKIIGGDVRIPRAAPGRTTMLEAYESVYAYRQQEYIEKKHFSGTGNLAMRRAVFDAVGPFAGIDVAEDRDWGRRAKSRGYRITYMADMIVYHPARENFEGIFAKWDRHGAHDFQEFIQRPMGRGRWLAYAIAILCSPLLEPLRILRSHRITGMRERWLAFYAVSVIRLHRFRQMWRLMWSRDGCVPGTSWNRQ